MRVVAGPEKKTRVMSAKERKITATTRWATRSSDTSLPNSDPIDKISVISLGRRSATRFAAG